MEGDSIGGGRGGDQIEHLNSDLTLSMWSLVGSGNSTGQCVWKEAHSSAELLGLDSIGTECCWGFLSCLGMRTT